jgi:hypothetical protein
MKSIKTFVIALAIGLAAVVYAADGSHHLFNNSSPFFA